MAPEFWKRRIIESASDATVVTTAFTGLPARVLRNRFADEYGASGAPVLPGLLQAALQQDIWTAAANGNNPEYMPLYAGQSVGLIDDLPSASEVVDAIMREASATLGTINAELKLKTEN